MNVFVKKIYTYLGSLSLFWNVCLISSDNKWLKVSSWCLHWEALIFFSCFVTFFSLSFHKPNATVIPGPEYHEETSKDTTESSQENAQDLSIIDYNTLNGLCGDGHSTEIHSAAKQGSTSKEVGEEIISTCVTPTRIKSIQHVLSKPETERHLCALKLLPHIFSKGELAESNTDGSHEKKCLDNTQLNALKILVFSKFPVSNREEKDKSWRFIKGKVNFKCRAARKTLIPEFTSPPSM